ncbi:hypothetical protein AnigIFM56816_008688 [Aspergillus niger]|nr:hypothetical protein AnigIFM56816_008688 [Aspergillus niger]
MPRATATARTTQANTGSVPLGSGDRLVRSYTRSRNGCFTCRLRRKKCDENHPKCNSCTKLDLICDYAEPPWWRSLEQRDIHKERMQRRIRYNKVMEKERNLQAFVDRTLPGIRRMNVTSGSQPTHTITYGPYRSETSTSEAPPTPSTAGFSFDNAQPSWQGSVPSALNILGSQDLPGQLPLPSLSQQLPLPSLTQQFPVSEPFQETIPGFSHQLSHVPQQFSEQNTSQMSLSASNNDWPQEYHSEPIADSSADSEQMSKDETLSAYLQAMNVAAAERPLLHHFVDKVVKLIFPVLDIHPQSLSRTHEILQSIETNKPYFHVCLSVSALHIKTVNASHTWRTQDKVIDDIMRHRWASISELCDALNLDENHSKVLDATLATILFHCAVGEPDDYLPDIPWYEHFTAVSDLVNKLGLLEMRPSAELPFSMSLTTWIDILGATMLGRSPLFAHAYRAKNLNGVTSGLQELMGCEDRIMYLISEIACLESLIRERRIDEQGLRFHVSALTEQLDNAEIEPSGNPCTSSGDISPSRLTENVTAVFRAAARLYLATLAPGFDRYSKYTADLVEAIGSAAINIPKGPYGFDRALVWPLFMAGAYSLPGCTFRILLSHRATALADEADYGSFGRMYRVLKECWKVGDYPSTTTEVYAEANHLLPSNNAEQNTNGSAVQLPSIETIGRPIKKSPVHWRDVMKRRDWHYLLM